MISKIKKFLIGNFQIQVLSTSCNGVFKIIDKETMEHFERKITVFLFDMTVVLQGVFKGGDFSRGILNLVPSSNKYAKSLH